MIFAAGVGSRLRPLTDELPKALIPVAGVALLERALIRLHDAGATEFVVNAHHHADKVDRFCAALAKRRGVSIAVSREDDRLLDTGGGLKKAAPLLAGDEPIFVHNADVLSEVDLRALLAAHRGGCNLATLACRKRDSSRQLLFDKTGILRGRVAKGEFTEWAGPPTLAAESLAFDGISVLSPSFLAALAEEGVFSVVAAWLRLAAAGEPIRVFRSDAWPWHDVGTPEKLKAAEEWAVERRL